MAALTIIRFLFRLKDVDPTNIADGFVLVARPDVTQPSGFVHEYEAQAGGGGGPPTGPAGGVLDGTYPNPGLAAAVAGAGLAETADVLSVNVDNSTIEISADALQVKDGGITPTKLSFDPATQAELDAHINDPTGAHAGTAISNTPAGGIAATDVQAAINELDTDKVATATFDDHSARHENGGADEISVAGLSGELADAQPVTVRKNTGADVGTRSRLNLIEGTNVTLTVADDAGSDEVDITIAASGGGGATCDDESCIIHMQVFA